MGVEHERPPRFGGSSTFSIITTANFAYRGILASSFKLLKIFPLVGFALSALSFIALIVLVVEAVFFGEYVGMIFTESRGRPLYVIRRTHGVTTLEDRRSLNRPPG